MLKVTVEVVKDQQKLDMDGKVVELREKKGEHYLENGQDLCIEPAPHGPTEFPLSNVVRITALEQDSILVRIYPQKGSAGGSK